MPRRKQKCIDCAAQCHPKPGTIEPRCRTCAAKHKVTTAKFKTRREYSRDWALRKKYDIDSDGFDVLWSAFQGRCGICDIELTQPTLSRGQPLSAACVDHDHVTGNIRGLLCGACNRAIGLLKDDYNICRKAMIWLGGTNE